MFHSFCLGEGISSTASLRVKANQQRNEKAAPAHSWDTWSRILCKERLLRVTISQGNPEGHSKLNSE